jgi:hypothetical protein
MRGGRIIFRVDDVDAHYRMVQAHTLAVEDRNPDRLNVCREDEVAGPLGSAEL